MKLKELRKEKGISQEEAASALGIALRTYQNYEYGQREPNIEMIFKLADFYGVTTDYLLGYAETVDPLAAYDIDEEERKFFMGFLNKGHAVRKCVIRIFKPFFEEFHFKTVDGDGKEKEVYFKNLF